MLCTSVFSFIYMYIYAYGDDLATLGRLEPLGWFGHSLFGQRGGAPTFLIFFFLIKLKLFYFIFYYL
jgi:hypothetical protein